MNKAKLFIIVIITLIAGMIIMGLEEELIVIRMPQTPMTTFSAPKKISKAPCTLSFWHQNKWRTEQASLLCSDNQTNTIKQLINAWLNVLEEEEILAKKVMLESVLLSASGQELFLSLSRTLFEKDEALIHKRMLIEGILKTLRENNVNVQSVRFLVHHQPLRDTQLDFSFSWPIHGFSH